MADQRSRAIEILRQARDSLIERLSERVLDEQEAILADARGDSYLGDIESLYEQVGGRLAHINQMLASLPPVEPTPDLSDSSSAPATPFLALPAPGKPWVHITGGDAETTALEPSPTTDVPMAALVHHVTAPQINFQSFMAQVENGELLGASSTLSILCDLSPERALRCTEVFSSKHAIDPEFLGKAMQLRSELSENNFNAVIMLLYECFGLVGLESIGVIQALRNKLLGIAPDASS